MKQRVHRAATGRERFARDESLRTRTLNSPTCKRGSDRSRRGLTILEILIVLALLIAIGAMVAPAMVGVLEDRALDSSVDVAQQQLMLARAHTQSSGRPIEVAYRPGPARIIARYFDAGERAIREGDRRAASLRGEDDAFAGSEARRGGAVDDDEDVLTWSWARRVLPRGVTVSRSAPREDGSESGAVFSPTPQPPPSGDVERPIRLAVFMPDGSALLATPVWLANERGRAMRLEVSVWTGLPRVDEHHGEFVLGREAASGEGSAR